MEPQHPKSQQPEPQQAKTQPLESQPPRPQQPKGRPQLGDEGRYMQQYMLNAESVDKKLYVRLSFDTTGNIRTTIKCFYPSLDGTQYDTKRTQIYRWKENRAKLLVAAAAHQGAHTKVRKMGVGTLLPNAVEGEIVQWVNDFRKEGIPISAFMLRETAKERAIKAGIKPFRALSSWVEGLKARHRFSMQSATRQGKIRPEDIDAVSTAFAAEVHDIVRQLGVSRVLMSIRLVSIVHAVVS